MLLIGSIAGRSIEWNGHHGGNHETEDNYIPPMLNPYYNQMVTTYGSPIYSTFFNGMGYNVLSSQYIPAGLQPVGQVYNVAQYGGVPMTYSPYGVGCQQEGIYTPQTLEIL